AALSSLIEPAGELWSVDTESPKYNRTRASSISVRGDGSIGISLKKGTSRISLDPSPQINSPPMGASSFFHSSSPSKMTSYTSLKSSFRIASLIVRLISSCVGQISFRSEEHTSELQSRENLVCRLLLD